jgi:hypothetical protein
VGVVPYGRRGGLLSFLWATILKPWPPGVIILASWKHGCDTVRTARVAVIAVAVRCHTANSIGSWHTLNLERSAGHSLAHLFGQSLTFSQCEHCQSQENACYRRT